MLDKLDVARIFESYADKARKAQSTEELKAIVLECRRKLDLRQIKLWFLGDKY